MKLVLENGRSFTGISSAADVSSVGDLVFNTSMVGYQEILSDPAYAGQIVVMTYPLMGQYGITDEDFESKFSGIRGLVVRECCETPSNFRYTKTLSEYLMEHDIPCISGLDTRMLTRILRNEGTMKAALVPDSTTDAEALSLISNTPEDLRPSDKMTCAKRWFSRTPQHNYDVVVLDLGVKHSIVTALNSLGCNVTVAPLHMSAEEILAFNPDGIVLSGGPGDPRELPDIVELINALKGRLPIFGTGLGSMLIALSYGATLSRMKCGCHGGHPVREMETGRIITAEHNCSYAIDEDSLEGTPLKVTWRDACDGIVDGISCPADRVYGVQFYPEGAPGPQESTFFKSFVKMMED